LTVAASGGRISARRKWASVGVATLLLAVAFFTTQFAIYSWLGDVDPNQEEAVPMTASEAVILGAGLLAVGVAFGALACLSRHPRPLRAAGVAWLVSLAAIVICLLVLGLVGQFDPFTPMVAGFGAGGLVALRAEPEHTVGRRAVAGFLITIYVFLLLRIYWPAGVIVSPLLPLPVLAWADAIAERRPAGQPTVAPGPRPGSKRSR
jgi:hypothetical protein